MTKHSTVDHLLLVFHLQRTLPTAIIKVSRKLKTLQWLMNRAMPSLKTLLQTPYFKWRQGKTMLRSILWVFQSPQIISLQMLS